MNLDLGIADVDDDECERIDGLSDNFDVMDPKTKTDKRIGRRVAELLPPLTSPVCAHQKKERQTDVS